jgi:hypothetical protein
MSAPGDLAPVDAPAPVEAMAQIAPRAPDGVGRVVGCGRPRGAPDSATPKAVQHRRQLDDASRGPQRITARFQLASGGTLHKCKATIPNAETAAIDRALGLDSKPGGTKQRHFRLERDL